MALSFLGTYGQLALSSQVGVVAVRCTDSASVFVELTSPGGNVLLAERFYPSDSVVTLRGLGSLMAAELRRAALAYGVFELTVSAGDEHIGCSMPVVHFDRFSAFVDCRQFFSENFLTTLSIRRIPAGFSPELAVFALRGESLQWSIAVTVRDCDSGRVLVAQATHSEGVVAQADGVVPVRPYWHLAVRAAADAFPGLKLEVMCFSVSFGHRQVTFFVDPQLDISRQFVFFNCFNVAELAVVPAATTSRSVTERSLAIVDGESRHYDAVSSREFDEVCGPLTAQEAEWIDQLLSSHRVMRLERCSLADTHELVAVPVIVTDATCEVARDGDKPAEVKFSWRYANNLPAVHLSANVSVFSSQFNSVFL